MDIIYRNCPICVGKSKNIITQFTREFPGSGPMVVSCSRCNLTYLSPVPTDKEYEKFYNNDRQRKFMENVIVEDYDGKVFDNDTRRVKLIKQYIDPGCSILDVGTGNSNFVGLMENAVGIDVSAPRVEAAIKSGRNVVNCNIFDWDKKVDVVTMFHVLEHITNPIDFVLRAKSILNDGGKLIIEVPNLNDALVGLNKYKDFYYQVAHCTYFTPSTLRAFLELCGLCVVNEVRLQRYSLDNHLHWLFRGRAGKFNNIGIFNQIYSQILKVIKKHDTIFVVCKKENING